MRKLLIIVSVLFFISCTENQKQHKLEQRVKTLEFKVDSLQQAIKWMTTTDSILVQEVFTPKGSLLEELSKNE
jgi:hypothetical protein